MHTEYPLATATYPAPQGRQLSESNVVSALIVGDTTSVAVRETHSVRCVYWKADGYCYQPEILRPDDGIWYRWYFSNAQGTTRDEASRLWCYLATGNQGVTYTTKDAITDSPAPQTHASASQRRTIRRW